MWQSAYSRRLGSRGVHRRQKFVDMRSVLVAIGVHRDHDGAARLQVRRQTLERLSAVGCVMEDAEAVDDVERIERQRQLEDVGLHDVHPRMGADVLVGGIHGQAQVDAHHGRAVVERDLGEPSGSAADVQHELALQLREGKTQALGESYRPNRSCRWRCPIASCDGRSTRS